MKCTANRNIFKFCGSSRFIHVKETISKILIGTKELKEIQKVQDFP
jgi:hypothetical protein